MMDLQIVNKHAYCEKMNSLALIQDYDSSDEEENEIKPRLPRPVLPEYDTLRSINRKPDETDNHEQRVRSFAHEAGNWATYVGIAVPFSESWCDLIDDLESKFSSLALKKVDNFHLSLTRVLVLKFHWINGFVDSLRTIVSNVSSFPITLQGLSVFLNDEKTRTFLSVNVQLGHTNLNHIVDQLDASLADYSLPKFYETRSFHVSVLWGLGDISEEIRKIMQSQSFDILVPINVNEIFCKTGNKIYRLPLQKR